MNILCSWLKCWSNVKGDTFRNSKFVTYFFFADTFIHDPLCIISYFNIFSIPLYLTKCEWEDNLFIYFLIVGPIVPEIIHVFKNHCIIISLKNQSETMSFIGDGCHTEKKSHTFPISHKNAPIITTVVVL